MQRLAAILVCISAQAAFAQCVAPASHTAAMTPENHATTANTTAAHTTTASAGQPAARAGAAGTQQGAARPTPELIKTAAASTRDDAPPAAVRSGTRNDADGQDHPRRGGTAMLLAALALMSGIALRRYGASNT